jgi:hypothetical protein
VARRIHDPHPRVEARSLNASNLRFLDLSTELSTYVDNHSASSDRLCGFAQHSVCEGVETTFRGLPGPSRPAVPVDRTDSVPTDHRSAVDNPNVCPVDSVSSRHGMPPSRRFQGQNRCTDDLVSSADSSRGPVDEQCARMSYPQLGQACILRFPHYPHFFAFLGGTGWKPPLGRQLLAGDAPARTPRRIGRLTPSARGRYNRRACRPGDVVAARLYGRNRREAYVPAKQPEACEDARLPCPHGHPWRACHHRSPASQGPQGPDP